MMHVNVNLVKKFGMEKMMTSRWMVCDSFDGKYHLQCSGIYYKEEQHEIDIENELFLCEEYE